MEHEERILTLMMDALDGELSAAEQIELETQLEAHPLYMQEWQALQAIDTLFRQTPALMPAADFAQRTIARLPNRRVRVWVLSVVYGLLLISGALPLLLGLWVFTRLDSLLAEPALMGSLFQLLGESLQIAGTLLRAVASGIGAFVVAQPVVLGWLLVMVGVIFVWGGVYRQLVAQSEQIS